MHAYIQVTFTLSLIPSGWDCASQYQFIWLHKSIHSFLQRNSKQRYTNPVRVFCHLACNYIHKHTINVLSSIVFMVTDCVCRRCYNALTRHNLGQNTIPQAKHPFKSLSRIHTSTHCLLCVHSFANRSQKWTKDFLPDAFLGLGMSRICRGISRTL